MRAEVDPMSLWAGGARHALVCVLSSGDWYNDPSGAWVRKGCLMRKTLGWSEKNAGFNKKTSASPIGGAAPAGAYSFTSFKPLTAYVLPFPTYSDVGEVG